MSRGWLESSKICTWASSALPGFWGLWLYTTMLHQTVKLGWNSCHPQRVVAKTEKAKAACSVKSSGSSHYTVEGSQIWRWPPTQSHLAASKQDVHSCLHLDNVAMWSSATWEPGRAAVSCRQWPQVFVCPELKSEYGRVKMIARGQVGFS